MQSGNSTQRRSPDADQLTKEQAINIVTEQIGIFESVLRRYRNDAARP
jgi:hypothetical protein